MQPESHFSETVKALSQRDGRVERFTLLFNLEKPNKERKRRGLSKRTYLILLKLMRFHPSLHTQVVLGV